MLRLLLGLLLLANAVFFGWSQGWFAPVWPAPHAGEREPERLAAQLRPESVRVLPASAASAAISAARAAALACLEAGPLADAQLAPAEAALASARLPEGGWQRVPAALPPLWLLSTARLLQPAALKAKGDELQALKLGFERLEAPPELAPALVLSRHATRAEAEAALAAAAPVRGLRVVSLPAPPAQHWLRVPRADSDQQDRLRALPAEVLAGGFKACAARP